MPLGRADRTSAVIGRARKMQTPASQRPEFSKGERAGAEEERSSESFPLTTTEGRSPGLARYS